MSEDVFDSGTTATDTSQQPAVDGTATNYVAADSVATNVSSDTVTNVEPSGTVDVQTTDPAPAEDTFFDPNTVPPELMPAYKNMQAQFTRRTQQLSQDREKIQAYDAFMQNPQASIMQMAQQYGLNITPAQAAAVAQQQTDPAESQDWQPQTWQELLDVAESRATKRIMNELQPVIDPMVNELRTVKKSYTEQMLDDSIPGWREFEPEMMDLLQKHPTLANDPVTLAEMAIPPHVRESRATQAALKKLEEKTKSAQVSKPAAPGVQASSSNPNQKRTFNEAYLAAKQQLAGRA